MVESIVTSDPALYYAKTYGQLLITMNRVAEDARQLGIDAKAVKGRVHYDHGDSKDFIFLDTETHRTGAFSGLLKSIFGPKRVSLAEVDATIYGWGIPGGVIKGQCFDSRIERSLMQHLQDYCDMLGIGKLSITRRGYG